MFLATQFGAQWARVALEVNSSAEFSSGTL